MASNNSTKRRNMFPFSSFRVKNSAASSHVIGHMTVYLTNRPLGNVVNLVYNCTLDGSIYLQTPVLHFGVVLITVCFYKCVFFP